MQSVADKDAPPVDGIVRSMIHKSSGYRMWPVDGGERTMLVFAIHVDPRGDVPSWIVNSFQDAYPLNNIKNIRKQAARPDVKEHPKVKEVCAQYMPKCGAGTVAPPKLAADEPVAAPPAAVETPSGTPLDPPASDETTNDAPVDGETP